MILSISRYMLPVLALLGIAACTDSTTRNPASYLLSYEVREPDVDRVVVCHAYECSIKTGVSLNDDDIATIRGMMAAGEASPAAERQAIAETIGWMERRVAPVAGTANDRDYRDLMSGGDASQLDCIDEASNSTSYMMLFKKLGLLRHHRIGYPIAKGFLLDGRYPHVTAVVIEEASGKEYSIDSWVFANGERAAVSPLDVWLSARSEDVYRSRYPSGEKNS
ncbi:MAG: hypothetical protein K8F25_00995 [Fimbriimonadaceae bacterium]|nr:hypothetical protein [Alphaproteobacteria bacterium]